LSQFEARSAPEQISFWLTMCFDNLHVEGARADSDDFRSNLDLWILSGREIGNERAGFREHPGPEHPLE
jgi:hypothetical protein